MWVQRFISGFRHTNKLFKSINCKPLPQIPFFQKSLNYGILSSEFVEIFEQREKFLAMPLDEKRQHYTTDFISLSDIPTWSELHEKESTRLKGQFKEYFQEKSFEGQYTVSEVLNEKVSIFHGDITKLEVDGIVNAANTTLLGGGVDDDIHKAAGPNLLKECRMVNGCKTGDAKLTGGYLLPAKYVIHTVGPKGEKSDLLKSCYKKCLEIAISENMKSIAFPCVSTGIYGYPQEAAAVVALKTIRNYLEGNPLVFDRVIFCTCLPVDKTIYECLLQLFFPIE